MVKHLSADSAHISNSSAAIQEVEICLKEIFDTKAVEARSVNATFEDLITETGNLVTRGGKRLRPLLVMEAYNAYGGTNKPAILKVAASQELFHAFALIHDDIIDRDMIRWGGPNIAAHYLKQFAPHLDPDDARHYADSWALLAGDLCLNLAFEALATSGFSPAYINRASQIVQQTLFVMIGGEVMDTAGSIYASNDDVIEDGYFRRLYDAKTSVYSFSTPLRLGALLAGASRKQDKCLQDFGYNLGIAFQIRDDILGIFGDEAKLGKSTLSDIREGRRTMLMSYGLKLANNRQKQTLKAILGNSNATYNNLEVVKTILRYSGALSQTEDVMLKHCHEAHRLILESKFPQALCDYLADLISYCAKRTE